jgi:basic amino acid/polyamine antiporter, APA family
MSNNLPTLVRGLGLIAAISILIGNVIGQGIFFKARIMTCNVSSPTMVISVWVLAGLLSLAGALTYAELAAMMPKAGGEYIFIRDAYGRRLGFLYGWMQFFIGKAGSQAALGIGFAIFLNILTGNGLNRVYLSTNLLGYKIDFGTIQIIAITSIVIVTLINCAAVALSGTIAALLTGLKILLVLAVGAAPFMFANGDWSNFLVSNSGGLCEGVSPSAQVGLAGFGAAMLGALWAYDGWNNVTLVAGEVKDPERNIPIALIGGMLVVASIYIFVNISYFYVLTPTEIASIPKSSSVATESIARAIGPLAVSLVGMALLISTFGTLHSSILTGARVPYAMAQDGLFLPALSRLSKRTHVPIAALVAQAVWASILALSGSYDALTDYVVFALWIFYALSTASVFIFRRRFPNMDRPYRVWGYPIVPILFLIVTGWLLVNTLITNPVQSIVGLALIALGLPVYWYSTRIRI